MKTTVDGIQIMQQGDWGGDWHVALILFLNILLSSKIFQNFSD